VLIVLMSVTRARAIYLVIAADANTTAEFGYGIFSRAPPRTIAHQLIPLHRPSKLRSSAIYAGGERRAIALA
jgi:hypothetical protein